MGLIEANPGTHSSDSECENSSTPTTIIALSLAVALILIIVGSVFTTIHIQKKKLCKR